MNDGSVKLLSISQLKCSIASFLCQRLILLTKHKSKLCNIEAHCLLIKVFERVCIHHNLIDSSAFSSMYKDLLRQSELSCKIKSLMSLLDEIKQRNEKVLIFATSKVVQSLVSALVTYKYKLTVNTVNGDTKAISTTASDESRKGIIDEFQKASGFGVLVMSPVAAGVGLTITGANNVIHLERHWNPAKEAQATDRVYRIGQTKQVNVYIPIATHSTQKSFDVQLSQLLGN